MTCPGELTFHFPFSLCRSSSLAKQSAATTATPAVAAGEPVLAKAVPTTTTGAQECKLARTSLLANTFGNFVLT